MTRTVSGTPNAEVEAALIEAAEAHAMAHNALVELKDVLEENSAAASLPDEVFLKSTEIDEALTELARRLNIEIPNE